MMSLARVGVAQVIMRGIMSLALSSNQSSYKEKVLPFKLTRFIDEFSVLLHSVP